MENLTVVQPRVEVLTPLEHISDFMRVLELAGRTCYKSEHKMRQASERDFVGRIIRSGHESVIEHCNITVKFVGSRAMSHQLVRHRLAAYSQESQRYCDYEKLGLQIIVPTSLGGKLFPGTWRRRFNNEVRIVSEEWINEDYFDENKDTPGADLEMVRLSKESTPLLFSFLEQVNSAYKAYLYLRDAGIPPQDARFILPNATKTEVVTTFNLRQWRHVFKERALNKHAQWEIRGIMKGALVVLNEQLPIVFGDLVEELEKQVNEAKV